MSLSHAPIDVSDIGTDTQTSAEAVKLWISELTDFSPQKIDEIFATMQQDQS
jgi:hypothetical protein